MTIFVKKNIYIQKCMGKTRLEMDINIFRYYFYFMIWDNK